MPGSREVAVSFAGASGLKVTRKLRFSLGNLPGSREVAVSFAGASGLEYARNRSFLSAPSSAGATGEFMNE